MKRLVDVASVVLDWLRGGAKRPAAKVEAGCDVLSPEVGSQAVRVPPVPVLPVVDSRALEEVTRVHKPVLSPREQRTGKKPYRLLGESSKECDYGRMPGYHGQSEADEPAIDDPQIQLRIQQFRWMNDQEEGGVR